jgi:hypothetical protein
MNALTVVLFAILLMVSTHPDKRIPSNVALVALPAMSAAGNPVATATHPETPMAKAPAQPQPDAALHGEHQALADVTKNFMQNRLQTAAATLQQRFMTQ